MAASLKEKQIAALQRVINLNAPLKSPLSEPVWKVLVYDTHAQHIISPLLAVKQLRDLGVTLHLPLHSARQTIPDTPVIYLCVANEENIGRIVADLGDQLYDQYHFNFLGPIPRQLLEDLAAATLRANCVASVKKVFDQYVHFVSLENDMFVLRDGQHDDLSYYALNRGDVKDTEMDGMVDSIVNGLLAVCVTLGQVPIIRCSRNNAAEMVAERLERKLRENLRDARSSLFDGAAVVGGGAVGAFQRPLLVVLDRNMDLATPLHHTWTYQALAHDVLELRLNRVTVHERASEAVNGASTPANSRSRTYDLSSDDYFWHQHRGSPFPVVAEAVQEELEKYKASEEEMKRLKSDMGMDAVEDENTALLVSSEMNTSRLTSAVTSLPQLLNKKRQLDAHTSIATAILEHIKRRRLDSLFEIEEKLLSRHPLSSSASAAASSSSALRPTAETRQLHELLTACVSSTEAAAEQFDDALRLYLIDYISDQKGPDALADPLLQVLQQHVEAVQQQQQLSDARGDSLAALAYVKRWKMLSRAASGGAGVAACQGADTRTINMFSKLVSHGSHFVMEGVKNLVVKKHELPVTRVVDALMQQRCGVQGESEQYRWLDPRLLRPSSTGTSTAAAAAGTRSQAPFSEAIVFMVGGGNYIEYQNLMDYVKNKSTASSPRRIIYGCTDLQNSTQFLRQLANLGRNISQ